MSQSLPVRRLVSGLCLMPPSGHGISTRVAHTLTIPAGCCPVSHNPREGSTLTLWYRTAGETLEVYSLAALLRRFVGGFPGIGPYPPERNMEGMVQLACQMAADGLRVPVSFNARILLDTGEMRLRGTATPCP